MLISAGRRTPCSFQLEGQLHAHFSRKADFVLISAGRPAPCTFQQEGQRLLPAVAVKVNVQCKDLATLLCVSSVHTQLKFA